MTYRDWFAWEPHAENDLVYFFTTPGDEWFALGFVLVLGVLVFVTFKILEKVFHV